MTIDYFQRVRWTHANPEDPVVLWAHVVDGWEARKVDEFADGRLVRADAEHETAGTRLGTAPVPRPDEIAADPQFVVEVVDRAAFESVWRRALDGP
ncbi:hypothetical protein [Jiangella sp. DSM 45060]|uniref:DUF6881 domain-containing protein n=1 Tax=Jiangella sp. DSM 45060 TaxID=1798224 RepID=UPI00087D3B9B|nr:hypothetical protein [Jiangella sp. DSM 45060]SDS71852.1 hypothetical protein SAMN04515669_1747 [Jiangella sp. DSM 45060]